MYQDSTVRFRQKRVINCSFCPFKARKKCDEDMCWDYAMTRLAACEAILRSLDNAELFAKRIDAQVVDALCQDLLIQ